MTTTPAAKSSMSIGQSDHKSDVIVNIEAKTYELEGQRASGGGSMNFGNAAYYYKEIKDEAVDK